MDKKSKHLLDFISRAIDHSDVSGFEALEVLDLRSRLASREPLLDELDRARLLDHRQSFFSPIFHLQTLHSSELSLIIGNQCPSKAQRVCRN